MALRKPRRDLERERQKEAKEAAREWIYMLGAIAGAFISAPLFFFLVAMAMGGALAMIVCVIEINLIVSLGSFALACRIFRQEPPEPGDILRIIGSSSFPAMVLASWIGAQISAPAWAVWVAAALVAAVIAALICMFQVGMPVWPSVFVCFSYNVLSVILTVVGYVMLGVIFAGYMITTGGEVPKDLAPMDSSEEAPLGLPGGAAPDESDDEDLTMSRPWRRSEDSPQRTAAPGWAASRSARAGREKTQYVSGPTGTASSQRRAYAGRGSVST